MRGPVYIYDEYNNESSQQNDDEFAEYLWMEDIDTFDKQVLQELVEEDEMEKCMEEMLAEEEARETVFFQNQQQQQFEGNNMFIGYIPYDYSEVVYESEPELQHDVTFSTLSEVEADNILARSNLNPCAKEFVPRNCGVAETSRESLEDSSEATER